MSSELFAQLKIRPIINAVGYATRVSGSCPHPEIIAAMAAASGDYFEIDDLLIAANDVIRQATGAEAGIVTCGAAAALSLAAAACLAGNSPELMERLPDVSACPRCEIIVPVPGPFDYDHALRLAGARLVPIDYQASDALAQIENAISPQTAAIGGVWLRLPERPDMGRLAELAHRHELPLIVDAACALPPATNLTSFIARGADLVAYSGGKHLGGPQASGFLCGRADLIRSAWLQMADMDVRNGTWSMQQWVESGLVSRPPGHGIGRSMKVSKEAIVGVMTALRRYAGRDHAAEQVEWSAMIDELAAGLGDLPELRITQRPATQNGRYPFLQIESGAPLTGLTVRNLILALRNRHTRILLAEDEQSSEIAYLKPQCLRPADLAEIVSAIHETVAALRRAPAPR